MENKTYSVSMNADMISFLMSCIDTHVRNKGVNVAANAVVATQTLKQAVPVEQPKPEQDKE